MNYPSFDMNDRLFIATQVAAGFMTGIPLSDEDILLGSDSGAHEEAKKCCVAVAKLSFMMADELLKQATDVA